MANNDPFTVAPSSIVMHKGQKYTITGYHEESKGVYFVNDRGHTFFAKCEKSPLAMKRAVLQELNKPK